MVAMNPSDRAVIDDLVTFQASLGLAAHRASVTELRQLIPALSPSLGGGAHVPGDHRVDNRQLVRALLAACTAAGVELVRAQVEQVRVTEHTVHGLVLDDGAELHAPTIVVTAGAQAARIGGLALHLPPLRPVKGQILRLAHGEHGPLFDANIRGIVDGHSCYLVARDDGSIVVGATVEERGFDTTVQAGAIYELLHDARRLVPGIDEFELVECLAGLRPATPDNAPYIGWTEIEGLALATGHFRNGILLAPITAGAVCDLIAGRSPSATVLPFAPERMATRVASQGAP
jgi:glycine oxidase